MPHATTSGSSRNYRNAIEHDDDLMSIISGIASHSFTSRRLRRLHPAAEGSHFTFALHIIEHAASSMHRRAFRRHLHAKGISFRHARL